MEKIIKQRVLLDIVFVLLNVFLTIFVYKNLGNIYDTVFANLINYTGLFFTFVLASIFLSWYKINIKHIFTFGILLSAFSFFTFYFGTSKFFIYTFMFLWGAGQGFVWNGIHTNELVSIKDEFKTKYVSQMGFYRRITSIIIPFILTLLFATFHDTTYYIIFFLVCVCLFVSAFYAYITFSYIPEKVDMKDWKNFNENSKIAPIKTFMLIDGTTQTMLFPLGAISAFLILTTEVNVGLYQTIASFISLGFLYIGTKKRKDSDNGKILLISIFSYVPFLLFFAISPNIFTFLCLSIAQIICLPQMSISRHFIDLTIMKMGDTANGKFYPNMIFREIYLFSGRLFSTLLFLFVLNFYTENLQMLSIGYFFLAIFFSLKAIVGYRVISKIQKI